MKVTHVNKARKNAGNCRKCGKAISKGDSYFWFKHAFSSRTAFCDKHRPRASDMTKSDKLATLYAISESIDDASGKFSDCESPDDLANMIEEVASEMESQAEEVREVGEQYRESASNMESAFPNGSSIIDEINEKADNCDEWAAALESAANDLREIAGRANELVEVENQDGDDDLMSLAEEAADRANDVVGELSL